MKNNIIALLASITASILASSTSAPSIQNAGRIINPKHSKIHIQKILNASSENAFIALERVYAIPLADKLDLTGNLIPGDEFVLKDSEEKPYSFAVPVWQNAFKGNTFNVITLSGKPGRIYFLYVIDGHLWAIKAPNKKGDLKGIHLLDPVTSEQIFSLKILDNNKLEIIPISGTKTKTSAQHIPAQSLIKKRTVPQAPALKRMPPAPQHISGQRPRRHLLPRTTQTTLRNLTPH